jgi:membrane protease YdiL (CAAX protease family)
MAQAVLFAWVYFNTKSLLMPVLYHTSINKTLCVFGVLNSHPATPNTGLLLINALLTWAFVELN